MSDFHIYDPTTNKWDVINGAAFKVPDLTTVAPSSGARYGACAFTINNVPYVGTGANDNTWQDFYSYSFANNTWTQIAGIEHKTQGATSFVVNNLGYVLVVQMAQANQDIFGNIIQEQMVVIGYLKGKSLMLLIQVLMIYTLQFNAKMQ